MKLQLGKRYRTRDGQETSPLDKSDDLDYPFKAEVDGVTRFWTEEGLWNRYFKVDPNDLVEEIEEEEEPNENLKEAAKRYKESEQEPRIDYDKMYEDLEKNLKAFTYAWNESKYTKTEQEDGTIILKPKKNRKVWVEVYDCGGNIYFQPHHSKEECDESIEGSKDSSNYTLLEVIEREYPINKEKC